MVTQTRFRKIIWLLTLAVFMIGELDSDFKEILTLSSNGLGVILWAINVPIYAGHAWPSIAENSYARLP